MVVFLLCNTFNITYYWIKLMLSVTLTAKAQLNIESFYYSYAWFDPPASIFQFVKR